MVRGEECDVRCAFSSFYSLYADGPVYDRHDGCCPWWCSFDHSKWYWWRSVGVSTQVPRDRLPLVSDFGTRRKVLPPRIRPTEGTDFWSWVCRGHPSRSDRHRVQKVTGTWKYSRSNRPSRGPNGQSLHDKTARSGVPGPRGLDLDDNHHLSDA